MNSLFFLVEAPMSQPINANILANFDTVNTPFIHPSAYVDEGAQIGANTKIWHFCHIMPGAKIGENCILGQNVFVANQTLLGNGVKVQNNVSIYSNVYIEDDCFLGPSMVFTNVINPRAFIERKQEYKDTHLRRGSSIGANATIVCGVELGEYCFIGAGAVVTKDVPPYALIAGVPGKQIGWISKHGERLYFNERGTAQCPISQETYQFVSENEIIALP
jgi:UDP-2-acetamido-3-amino-2,3-dideoxy-glucuronate N-acetyltransferase